MNRSYRQQFELTMSLAKRDIKARYKDSILGFFWSLLRPAFLTLVLWLVFSKILPMPFTDVGTPFWLHVLVSVLGWNFFLGSITDATHSVTSNSSLMKKVRMDAEVFPIASIISNGVHFALALAVVMVILVFTGIGLHSDMVILPVVFLAELLLILGISFVLSCMQVYYRDVASVLELGGLAMFYLTPVIYPVSVAFQKLEEGWGRQWAHLYMLNPMAPIIAGLRRGTLYVGGDTEMPDADLWYYLAISLAVSAAVAVGGWLVFRWFSRDFVDQL